MDTELIGGRYRLDGELGSGGMGTVWRAYDELLARAVAVKEIRFPPHTSAQERAALTARAMTEARAAAALTHPAIVAVHDVTMHDDRPWIVMQLVPGRSLQQLVNEEGPLSQEEAAQLGLRLLDALQTAHAGGVTHRDVKPSNVLMPGGGATAMLTDFSIAKVMGYGTTNTGVPIGSAGYIAPERMLTGVSGFEGDLFGLGATLFFALEGLGPFHRPDPMVAILAAAVDPHPRPKRAGHLTALLDALLTKDPRQRATLSQARALLQTPTTVSAAPLASPPLAPPADMTPPLAPPADMTPPLTEDALTPPAVSPLTPVPLPAAIPEAPSPLVPASGADALLSPPPSANYFAPPTPVAEALSAGSFAPPTPAAEPPSAELLPAPEVVADPVAPPKPHQPAPAQQDQHAGVPQHQQTAAPQPPVWPLQNPAAAASPAPPQAAAAAPVAAAAAADTAARGAGGVEGGKTSEGRVVDDPSTVPLPPWNRAQGKAGFSKGRAAVPAPPPEKKARREVAPEPRQERQPQQGEGRRSRRGLLVAGAGLLAAAAVGGTGWALRGRKAPLKEGQSTGPTATPVSNVDVLSGHRDEIWAVAWAPNSQQLASASADFTVRLWAIGNATSTKVLTGHAGEVYSVEWSPDGTRLATGAADNTARIWLAETGAAATTLQHDQAVRSVAWSPDGKLLATGSNDRKVRIWDAASGQLVRTLVGHTTAALAVAWAPDGNAIASIGDLGDQVGFLLGSVIAARVWNPHTGSETLTVTTGKKAAAPAAHSGTSVVLAGMTAARRAMASPATTSVAWSPDSALLATGNDASTTWLWDAKTGEQLRVLGGHSDIVNAVAFKPDEPVLATASSDLTILLWNPGSSTVLRTFTGHASAVNALAFSPDGKRLVSGSSDKTLRLWAAVA